MHSVHRGEEQVDLGTSGMGRFLHLRTEQEDYEAVW